MAELAVECERVVWLSLLWSVSESERVVWLSLLWSVSECEQVV